MESDRRVRLAIAGGGTGGHVLPAVAVVEELQRRDVIEALLWIGSRTGLECETARNAGIPYEAIQTGKLRRYFSLQTATDAARIPIGLIQARRHIRSFQPTVVFSTGGFVSVPTVIAARGQAPILTHEQTATLGLATRINARVADAVAVSYESTALVAGKLHRHVVVTGNPVRSFLTGGNAQRALARWTFEPDLMLIYVTGGSLGASPLNQRIAALLPELLHHAQVLHQAGAAANNDDAATLTARRASWPANLRQRYQVVEFVGDELPDLYAAVDLVVGRAGAGTVAEIAALGKPSILIPLPGTGGDEQTKNAQVLADAGAAVVVSQAAATPDRLRNEILRLLGDRARLAAMGAAARTVGRADAAVRLADEVLALHRR